MRNFLVCMGAILLAACANGGDDAPAAPAVPAVATKVDAQRELANAASVASTFLTSPGTAGAAPVAFAGAKSWQPKQLRLPMQTSARSPAGLAPQAATTANCSSGGTSTYDSGSKTRDFPYFAYSQAAVSWSSYSDNQCTDVTTNQDGTSQTFISNGFDESGSTNDGYSYDTAGAGGVALALSIIDKTQAGAVTSRLDVAYRGTIEEHATATLVDTRLDASLDLSLASGGQTITASQALGGSAPFKVTETSAGALTIDGDFTYTSNLPGCAGGTETYQTLSAITFGTDNYPNGGTLKVSAGGAYVTITFKSDGSADLVFSNGSMSSMTAAEVHEAVDFPSCSPG